MPMVFPDTVVGVGVDAGGGDEIVISVDVVFGVDVVGIVVGGDVSIDGGVDVVVNVVSVAVVQAVASITASISIRQVPSQSSVFFFILNLQ